jgi:hypothetical protein
MSRGGVFDNTEVEVTCPNGHPITKKIADLRRSPTFACDVCGATIEVDGSDLDRGLRDVDRAFDDLKKSVRKLGR